MRLFHLKSFFLSSLKNLEPFIKAAKIARENNIAVILNPGMLIIDQGLDNIKQLLEKIDILILSQREYKTLLKIKNQNQNFNNKSLIEKSENLKKLGIKVLIITMGEKGAILICNNNSESISPIKVEKVVDTTGAGDAFLSGILISNLNNFSIEKTSKFATAMSYLECREIGVREGLPTSLGELEDFIANNTIKQVISKIV